MATKYTASLRDIATHTGVSISTVSRVLRQKGETSAETREKILAAAQQLGYQDNLLVQGIRTGRTRTVGVGVSPDHAFHSEILMGIHDTLAMADYAPLVVWSRRGVATEREQLHRFVERRVEGVILRVQQHDAGNSYFSEMLERGLPVVLIDSDLSHANLPFVGTDDLHGAALVARYLVERGHKVIGQLAAAAEFTTTGRDRLIGFSAALAEHSSVQLHTATLAGFDSNIDAGLDLLRRTPRPTAVFAANDDVAVGIYDAAAALGLRIPQDLAVIGFGDLPLAQVLRPRLTTVQQHPHLIGKRAVEVLFNLLNGGGTASAEVPKVRVSPELIIREST